MSSGIDVLLSLVALLGVAARCRCKPCQCRCVFLSNSGRGFSPGEKVLVNPTIKLKIVFAPENFKRKEIMKKTALPILLFIMTISATGQVNGKIEENNGKQVLTVWGTHEERGYAHGYLAGQGLKDIFDNYIINYLCQGSRQEYQNLRNFFLAYYSIEPKYRSEAEALIRGMLDNGIILRNQTIGRDIDADDVLICSALPDLSQTSKGLEKMKLGCSSISSWGFSTQEDSVLAGQLIITRLMDWDNHSALCRNHLLIVQIPAEEDEQKWISLAFTGFLGSLCRYK